MPHHCSTRREFLKLFSGAAAAGLAVPYILPAGALRAAEGDSENERPVFGCIGCGDMAFRYPWKDIVDLNNADKFGRVVAVCDVDLKRAEDASDGGKRAVYQDYRKLLDRQDIDAVTITTPDHWHVKIAIDALRAGKDVFLAKPATLTIDEGKQLWKVAQEESKRIIGINTQQRSDERFLKAVAMCQLGRIGKIHRVTCAIGDGPSGGPFGKQNPPPELDWNLWLGQAPKVDYRPQRCHGNFRWWYDYSGGKLTDWGAHHVDIAQWAIGMDRSGPTSVEVVSADLPVPFEKGYPTVDDCFNTPTAFQVKCLFENGVEMIIRHDTDNGILFEGEKGRFFVNRGKLVGTPTEWLKEDPIPEEVITRLHGGKPLFEAPNPWTSQMANFVQCLKDRSTPVSDVYTNHRGLSTCHLANIAIRLGREKITWDPKTEQIVGDDEANDFLSRPPREGYEISA
ncbi:MAG: Gfo/Idh/MocA family oxidoreductase [Patescibacteria group bacterium]|nr:Gfo/Idh/MocA family oxidoreductase [Patescibacteria group bacterium]